MFLFVILLAGTLLWLAAQFLLKPLFFSRRFYIAGAIVVAGFLAGYFMPVLEPLSYVLFWLFIALLAIDMLFVFAFGKSPEAGRIMPDRMSNGDKNAITLAVKNNYPFTV